MRMTTYRISLYLLKKKLMVLLVNGCFQLHVRHCTFNMTSNFYLHILQEKHNPYLELIVGTRKKISSVVKHLNTKWGKPKMSSGELMLFPYYARQENLTSYRRWTLKDHGITVTDVHVAMGSPATFRLRFLSFLLVLFILYDFIHCKENLLS